MRIKFLAIIAGFLFMSIAVSSCLDSEDNIIEFSSDATVHAFGLDTIYGKHYQFTIDQLSRVIYNRDSLPVGADTIIDRILVDTFSVRGWITAGVNDTLFNSADSVDLANAVNNEGMKFKVHAQDGVTIREYTLKINRHKQDPDSMQWIKMNPISINGAKKSVLFNGALYTYGASQAYKGTIGTESEGFPINWESLQTNLTGTITSLLNWNNALYATVNNKVYSSTDGSSWTEQTILGDRNTTLVTAFKDWLSAIVVDADGKLYFNKVNTQLDGWIKGDIVPNEEASASFPTSNLVSTTFFSSTNIEQSFVVGNQNTDDKYLVPWMTSFDKMGWADLTNSVTGASCPNLKNPSIIHYNNAFYIFGGEFETFYKSQTGIAWYKVDSKFWMPKEFKEKAKTESYSAVADENGFIWIIWNNEVWRGRLNKLGFKIQ